MSAWGKTWAWAGLVGLVGCSAGTGDGNGEAQLLTDFVHAYVGDYLEPATATWRTEADALATAVTACEGLSPAGYELEAQADIDAAYRRAFTAYKRLTIARFGPFDEQPYRIAVKADSWPVDPARIELAIAAAPDAAGMQDLGADQRGYPGLGWVLYEHLRDPTMDQGAYDAGCAYAQAAAADVAFLAGQWRKGFFDDDPAYVTGLTDPGQIMDLDDDIAVLTHLLQNILDAAQLVREENVEAPIGEAPSGALALDKLEARAAGLSLASVDATVDAARQVLLTSDRMETGVDALWETRNSDASANIESVFADIDATRANLDGTLEQALENDLDDVNLYVEALRGLATLVRADIMGGLGLTVSFTDSDAD